MHLHPAPCTLHPGTPPAALPLPSRCKLRDATGQALGRPTGLIRSLSVLARVPQAGRRWAWSASHPWGASAGTGLGLRPGLHPLGTPAALGRQRSEPPWGWVSRAPEEQGPRPPHHGDLGIWEGKPGLGGLQRDLPERRKLGVQGDHPRATCLMASWPQTGPKSEYFGLHVGVLALLP